MFILRIKATPMLSEPLSSPINFCGDSTKVTVRCFRRLKRPVFLSAHE